MVIKNNMLKFLFPVLLAALLMNSRCKKDNDSIPNVSVDLTIYLSQPSSVKLNAVGGWIYTDGGVRGIIVYRRSNDEFAAYERDCPFDPNAASARVEVDSSNIIAVDRNCGSKFNLLDNSIINIGNRAINFSEHIPGSVKTYGVAGQEIILFILVSMFFHGPAHQYFTFH